MIEIYTTMCANEINGTCTSASTSRGGGMFFFRSDFCSSVKKNSAAKHEFFFSLPKSEYFSATLGIRLFFLKKKHIPPV